MNKWHTIIPLSIFILTIIVFFYPFLFFGKIPIPADTIVGMYHPWRDAMREDFSNGVPYKNPLITDPVRQQYVWREVSIEELKQGKLPLWNPYSFSGTPLLANFQSAVFYPLNILFFILPFSVAWGIGILMQPLLSGVFLYLYLRHFAVNQYAAALGGLAFSFSGFSIAWLEWNTVVHTILWLPLALLSIEKVLRASTAPWIVGLIPTMTKWLCVFTVSLICSLFAGHLQVFFYTLSFLIVYLLCRFIQLREKKLKILLHFTFYIFIVAAITSIQWVPTFQFIQQSAREVDQGSWEKPGWFIPWQHLLQFIAPDFFGNPATNNYWGEWNYGEFVGYIGILPLLFVLYALIFRNDRKTWLFGGATIVCLLMALPSPLAELPYRWNIPFLGTSQPTRLLSLICFCLSILAAFGLDDWIKRGTARKTLICGMILLGVLTAGWLFALEPDVFFQTLTPVVRSVAKKNLILPTALIGCSLLLLFFQLFGRTIKATKFFREELFGFVVLLVVAADLLRFGWKFTPFSPMEWLYPQTEILQYIKDNQGYQRTMATDRRILPSNMSAAYGIYDISGYDPLYLLSYNQLVGAWTKNNPDIKPSAFNRILTPENPDSFFTDLLGVKYVVSFGEHQSQKLKFIMNEGQTYLYENPTVFPKAFFVQNIVLVKNKHEEMKRMYELEDSLRTTAVTTEPVSLSSLPLMDRESARVVEYTPSTIRIITTTMTDRLMVLTDPWYPTWRASVDGREVKTLEVDFLFRGVVVPRGEHTVELKNYLL